MALTTGLLGAFLGYPDLPLHLRPQISMATGFMGQLTERPLTGDGVPLARCSVVGWHSVLVSGLEVCCGTTV